MIDVLKEILYYRQQKGWTEYQLAEHSGLPQTTISSWYCKNTIPTIPSLEKICAAFDITLSQLFSHGGEPVLLTASQQKLLKCWAGLSSEQQALIFSLLDNMK